MLADAKAHHDILVEKVSESDDKLLEKYLGGEAITEAELKAGLRKRCIESVRKEEAPFVPVICGTAFKNKGVQPMLDAVVDYLPSPLDIPPVTGIDPDSKDENKIERSANDKEPFSALAFKIMTDPFVGQLTFFRVYSGTLTSGSSVINSTKGTHRAHWPPAEDARQQARRDQGSQRRRHRRRRRPEVGDHRRHAVRREEADHPRAA